MADLETVLADAREKANALRVTGNTGQAQYIDQIIDQVAEATEDVRRWLSENDARMRSGFTMTTLRRRFHDWLATGHARYGAKGAREYRLDIVPMKDAQKSAAVQRAKARIARSA